MPQGIGWIGDADFVLNGWAAEPGVAAPIRVYVEVFALDEHGKVAGPAKIAQYLTADRPRPDVPASDRRVIGEAHGFEMPLPPGDLPDGGYLVRARALASTHGSLLPGEVRIARTTVGSPPVRFSLRYHGPVGGLQRTDNYESYPTAMRDGNQIRMWFAGGPGDKIYYATSRSPSGLDGFRVYGNFRPVLQEGRTGPDRGLTADPSVVKVPFPDPRFPYRFFMYYTAVPSIDGRNGIFGAISTDGIRWDKMDPRVHTFGMCYPIITPLKPGKDGYGAGQSSVIWTEKPLGPMPPGLVHYFTDTTVGGPCVAVSTDGGWTFRRIDADLSKHLGDYTWDMKLLDDNRILGFVAIPGERFVGKDRRERVQGSIGLSVSDDGLKFAKQARIPMKWLTDDEDHQCINNGGLLGSPEGHIHGDSTVFYFGAGYGMQDDPRPRNNRWPPLDWDIAAVSVKMAR